MNYPAPEPVEPPPVQSRREASIWPAFAAGTLVFLAFAAYAGFAPRTYRAKAEVSLKPTGTEPIVLPTTPPPTARLRGAAIDEETLTQVAKELGLSGDASGQATAAQRIAAGLELTQTNATTFDFSFSAATATATQHVANLIARHAAARAERALAPPAPDPAVAREEARAKNSAELTAFLAAHPNLAPVAPTVVPVVKQTADTDPAALRAERDQIQAKLARLTAPNDGSDNPFSQATPEASADVTRLRRRVIEIDQLLKTRQRSDHKPEAAAVVPPDVDREWKRLVRAVADPVVPPPAAAAFTVMMRDAVLPESPLVPNVRGVVLLGALMGVLVTLVLTQLGRRRRAAGEHQVQNGEQPHQPSGPPGAGSNPPFAFDVTHPSADPPAQVGEPPLAAGSPALANTVALAPGEGGRAPGGTGAHGEPGLPPADPVRAPSDPPRFGSEPPQPIIAVTAQRASAHSISSNPPKAKISSNPPRPAVAVGGPTLASRGTAASSSSNPPPAATASGSPPVVSAPKPSPQPPAPSVPPAQRTSSSPPAPRPTPMYGELSHRPAAPFLKSTLVGMTQLDESVLTKPTPKDRDAAPRKPEPDQDAASRLSSESAAPRSTLRPPPPDASGTMNAESTPVAATPVEPNAGASDARQTQPDDGWTGPSRAHRHSMAARRTTQMLGSPIAPVVRGSRQPTEREPAPAPRTSPTPTTYRYVSSRPPEAAPPRERPDTPPYFQPARAEDAGRYSRHPPSTPRPARAFTRAPAARPHVHKHPVRSSWAPDDRLDPSLRRGLADELFPLAIESCLVIGVTSAAEVRTQKSRVAAELALALAEPRHPRVLLLEADFQWAAVHQVMHVEMPLSAGLSQQLRALAPDQPAHWTVADVGPTLHVLAEGVVRSPGLILSRQFEDGIHSLRAYYDLIVLDGPDIWSEVECRALSNVTDAIVLVAPASGAPDLARAAELFPDKRYSTVVGV